MRIVLAELLQVGHHPLRFDVPYLYCLVKTASGQKLAVGREGQVINDPRMATVRINFISLSTLPKVPPLDAAQVLFSRRWNVFSQELNSAASRIFFQRNLRHFHVGGVGMQPQPRARGLCFLAQTTLLPFGRDGALTLDALPKQRPR